MIEWGVQRSRQGDSLCPASMMTDVLNWAAEAAEAGGFNIDTLIRHSPWDGSYTPEQVRVLVTELEALVAANPPEAPPDDFRTVLERMLRIARNAAERNRGIDVH